MSPEAVLAAINQTPAHELVAEQLQRAIMLGRYLPGDKLPAERAMAEQFGVSRTSVREAIHVLVEHGLLEIRRGATGGAVVQDMIDDGVRQRMIAFARERRSDYELMLEFRLIVECSAAELAAERRTKNDLRALQQHIKSMDTIFNQADATNDSQLAMRFYAEDTAFHILIAEMSRNPFLHESVEELRYKMVLPLGRVIAQLDDHANDMHHEIYESIESGDGATAARTMREHIESSFYSVFGPKGDR